MLGFVTIRYYVDRQYNDNVIHNYDEDGDSFESIRDEAFRIFPDHRLVSMILDTGNDGIRDVTNENGSLRDYNSRLYGPSGQRYGDAIIDVHMSSIGPYEE